MPRNVIRGIRDGHPNYLFHFEPGLVRDLADEVVVRVRVLRVVVGHGCKGTHVSLHHVKPQRRDILYVMAMAGQ